MHHLIRQNRMAEIDARCAAEIGDLLGARGRSRKIALEVFVGRSDQREVALVGNRENDATVGILENVSVVVLE